jgi:hypothetical protein
MTDHGKHHVLIPSIPVFLRGRSKCFVRRAFCIIRHVCGDMLHEADGGDPKSALDHINQLHEELHHWIDPDRDGFRLLSRELQNWLLDFRNEVINEVHPIRKSIHRCKEQGDLSECSVHLRKLLECLVDFLGKKFIKEILTPLLSAQEGLTNTVPIQAVRKELGEPAEPKTRNKDVGDS